MERTSQTPERFPMHDAFDRVTLPYEAYTPYMCIYIVYVLKPHVNLVKWKLKKSKIEEQKNKITLFSYLNILSYRNGLNDSILFCPARQSASVKRQDTTLAKRYVFKLYEALKKIGHPPEWDLAAFFGKESPLVAAFGISAFELGVAPDVIYPIVAEGDDTIGGDCDDDGGSDGGSGGGGVGDGGGGGGGGGGGVGQESR
ncbi:hypothetical protein V1478_012437, partial [Vespula squamosa]